MSDKSRMARAPPPTAPPPDLFGGRLSHFRPLDLITIWRYTMEFFTSAIDTLKVLVIALGAGLGVWGVINLLEGYGNDNPGANAHV